MCIRDRWDTAGTNKAFTHSWSTYKQLAPNAKLYLFDLAGYGTTPVDIRENHVHLVAGWSDKIFDVLAAIETVDSALESIHAVAL